MALNKQVFKTRALTALIFVAVMLVGLLVNQWTFFLLFTVVHFGCWFEYQKLIGKIDKGYLDITPFHKYGVMIGGYGFMLWMLDGSYAIMGFKLQEIGWWLVLILAIALPITEVLFGNKNGMRNTAHSFFGLVYISLSWGLLMDLWNTLVSRNIAGNIHSFTIPNAVIPCFIIACMWVNDTMAYLVGSFIGKTPFSKISPKKTWEGTAGGAILCVIVMGAAMRFYMLNYYSLEANGIMQSYHWFIMAAIAAIVGTMGDLLESKLKRLADVKDSGSLMPGHGGFLDRFDSLLLGVPFVWLYLKLFL